MMLWLLPLVLLEAALPDASVVVFETLPLSECKQWSVTASMGVDDDDLKRLDVKWHSKGLMVTTKSQ